ncbi:TldD/PmbA family protein [Candidatus Phytoplasma oryzae]|nr:metallopeptidase TldD-related protein [Candidatus Phytoplasma oryzae]
MNNNDELIYEKWFHNAIYNKNFESLEFLINEEKNFTISLEDNEINEHTKSKIISTIVKGVYKQKKSSIYLEKINNNMLEKVLSSLKNQLEISSFESKEDIFSGSVVYPNIEINSFDFSRIDLKLKYNLLFSLSKKLSQNIFCQKVENISYIETNLRKKIVNSKGLNIETNENFAEIYVVCLFKKNNQIEEISENFLFKKFQDFNIENFAKKIIQKGKERLNACSLKSGYYDIIFSNKAFSKLLKKFSCIFNAMNVYHDLTKLKNKIGFKIASDQVNIIDDPLNSYAFFKYKFDDEGCPCKKKIIIEKGILKNFIHNLKTTNIFNISSSSAGNFFDNSIKMSNCYLKKGFKDLTKIISKIEKGVFIDNLIGLHAGVNDVTGDFSVQAEGFKIEKGQIKNFVKMIVVSGNFFDLLYNIKDIANDFLFDFSGFGSSSVYVDKLSIAGDD